MRLRALYELLECYGGSALRFPPCSLPAFPLSIMRPHETWCSIHNICTMLNIQALMLVDRIANYAKEEVTDELHGLSSELNWPQAEL